MTKILTSNKNYYDIADTIRQMKNVNTTYKPREMASALKDIYSNEVEGVPPLTFESNGMDLLDYRIDGASGGVGDKTDNLFDGIFLHRSVRGNAIGTDDVNRRSIAIDISNYNNGEKITFSRETALGSVFQMYQVSSIQTGGKLNNENVVSDNSNTLLATITITNVNVYPYLMIFLNGTNNHIEDEQLIASKIMINVGNTALPYEPYGYKVPVVISGKNLFDEIYTNIVIGWDVKYKSIFVGEGTFTLSTTCPKQDDGNATNLFFLSGNVSTGANSATNGVYNNHPVTVTSLNGYVTIGYRAQSYDPRNYTTMLNEGTTALPYEPFTEPTTTNIYLDEPINENESISLSDTNVDISTIEGKNELTIDTTVQPSNVYVQARKDPDEIVYLTQILEEEI